MDSLTVNASGAQAGLFGTVGAAGSVMNVALTNATITGSGTVGTLIGDNFGTVTGVTASGRVTNKSSASSSGTGGLIGKNEAGATITQVSSANSVSGGAAVGGLVGINAGTLSKAYATGTTKGAGAVGGLVGTNSGTVAQVYAVGAVSGPDNSNNGDAPTPEPSLGGLFGSVSNGSAVTAAFWNTQTTKQSQGTGTGSSTGMTGLTTDQMQDFTSYKTNYAGFDFVSTWAVPNKASQINQRNSNYPEFFGLGTAVVASFDGHVSYTGQAPSDLVTNYSPLRPGTFVTTLSTVRLPADAVDAGTYTAYLSNGLATSSYSRPIIIDNGTLVIDPKVLNVAGSKTYDGKTGFSAAQMSATGAAQGQTVTLAATGPGDAATASSADAGIYTGASLSGLTFSVTGGKASNYALPGTGTLTISKAVIGLTGRKTYDGNAGFTLDQISLSGAASGETLSLTGPTGPIVSAPSGNAGTSDNVAISGLGFTVTNGKLSNYILPSTGTLIIAQKSLTASLAGPVSKTYDGTNAATLTADNYALDGLVSGDTVSVSGAGAYDTSGAGTGKTVTVTGLTLGGDGAGNYTLTGTTASGAVGTIAKASLFVKAQDALKRYDRQAFSGNKGVTYTGFVAGEDTSVLGGTLTYGGTSQGAKNAGRYSITALGLTSDNYAIQFQDGTLFVNKAELNVSLTGTVSKTYDGTTSATLTADNFNFTAANAQEHAPGVIPGDTVSVSGKGTYNTANAGTGKTVTVTGLTLGGDSAGNYILLRSTTSGAVGTIAKAMLTASLAGTVSKTYDGTKAATLTADNYALTFQGGTLTITKASLTVTAKDASKTYDGQAFSGGNGVSYAGFADGEDASALGGTLAYGGTSQGAKNAGSYAIAASGLTSGNYTIGFQDGTLTVAKAPLTASLAGPVSKTYDGTKAATLTADNYVLTGVVQGDTVSVSGTGAYDTAIAGTGKTVTVTGLILGGDGVGNYTLTGTTVSGAVGTIGKALLMVTAKDASKTYDGQAFSGGNGVSYTGLVAGEDPSVLGGTLAYGGAAQGAKNAGRYALTASGLTSDDYAIQFQGGVLTVAKVPLTVTAADAAKTYDGQAFSGGNGVTYAGFVAGEDASVLGGKLAYGGTAQGAKNAGSYAIAASGLTSGNYTIGFQDGTLTVAKAPLTVTAADASKTYDGQAFSGGNGVSYAGFVAGEDASVLGGTLAYGGAAQGAKNAGRYALAASGLISGNYAIAFHDGALTVAPAPVEITAVSGHSVYGDSPVNPGLTATGLQNGDGLDALTGLSNSFGVTARSGVAGSPYRLTVAGVLSNGNYTVSARRDGTWTVSPRTLSVTANPVSRTAGAANPPLTYTTTGLLTGDELSGSLATSADGASTAGRYAITQGTLAAGGNYDLSYTGADLTVTAITPSTVPLTSVTPQLASTIFFASPQSRALQTSPTRPSIERIRMDEVVVKNPRFDLPVVCIEATGACLAVPQIRHQTGQRAEIDRAGYR
ncbi:beta strand repeat-containing protein [Methylobacterium persicinum]